MNKTSHTVRRGSARLCGGGVDARRRAIGPRSRSWLIVAVKRERWLRRDVLGCTTMINPADRQVESRGSTLTGSARRSLHVNYESPILPDNLAKCARRRALFSTHKRGKRSLSYQALAAAEKIVR
jgi:hypothetical protein